MKTIFTLSLIFTSLIGFAQENDCDLKPSDFVVADQKPEPLNMDEVRQAIGYPENARSLGIEGVISFGILVSKKGEYLEHFLYPTRPHPLLVSAVTDHIHELKFAPALKNETPVCAWTRITFEFNLAE